MYITAGVCSVLCQTNSCAFLRVTVPRTVVLFAFRRRAVLQQNEEFYALAEVARAATTACLSASLFCLAFHFCCWTS